MDTLPKHHQLQVNGHHVSLTTINWEWLWSQPLPVLRVRYLSVNILVSEKNYLCGKSSYIH